MLFFFHWYLLSCMVWTHSFLIIHPKKLCVKGLRIGLFVALIQARPVRPNSFAEPSLRWSYGRQGTASQSTRASRSHLKSLSQTKLAWSPSVTRSNLVERSTEFSLENSNARFLNGNGERVFIHRLGPLTLNGFDIWRGLRYDKGQQSKIEFLAFKLANKYFFPKSDTTCPGRFSGGLLRVFPEALVLYFL